MTDDQTWNFLGISGALICGNCGHPFEDGERTVLIARGEKVKDALNPDLFSEDEDGDLDMRATTAQRMSTFDLIHERCPV